MKKYILRFFIMILFFVTPLNIFCIDFTHVDSLYEEGKYKEGLLILEKEYLKTNPDPETVWRICRFYFEIAEETENKKEKIETFTKGMDASRQFLDITYGANLTRAQIIFWYAACYGSKGETVGIKESLDAVPELFKLAEKALSLDVTFAPAYLLMGRIDSAVPSFLGGDKFRLGENLSKALYYNGKDMSVLVDCARSFFLRDWDISKKKKNAEKKGATDGTPQNLSDKEYARQLLDRALELYKTLEKPIKRDIVKFKEANELIQKIK